MTVKTEYDWLFEGSITEKVLSYNYVDTDVASYDPESEMLIIADLYFPNNFLSCTRSYTKIQNLAANFGGVMKLFMFIGALIVKQYSLFQLRLEMIKCWIKTTVGNADIIPSQCAIKNNFLTTFNKIELNREAEHNTQTQIKSAFSATHLLTSKASSPHQEFKFGFLNLLLGSLHTYFRGKDYSYYMTTNKLVTQCLDYRTLIGASLSPKSKKVGHLEIDIGCLH